MKKLCAVALSVLILAGCGGNTSSDTGTLPTGGILGASWGESRDTVKMKFSSIEGVRLALDSTDLVFVGGSYEGIPVGTWVLSFQDEGTLWSGRIIFEADSAGSSTVAGTLESVLTGKYGAPTEAMTWNVQSPDGKTISTITLMSAEGQPVELRLENPAAMSPKVEAVSDAPVLE